MPKKSSNSVKISNSSPPYSITSVKYCDTFLSKLIGLMFTRELKQDFGLILVENNETRINTAIHMLFMNYALTVLWVDKNWVIVDKVLAKKWVPIYFPKKPAQYVVELHHAKFSDYTISDQLILSHED